MICGKAVTIPGRSSRGSCKSLTHPEVLSFARLPGVKFPFLSLLPSFLSFLSFFLFFLSATCVCDFYSYVSVFPGVLTTVHNEA